MTIGEKEKAQGVNPGGSTWLLVALKPGSEPGVHDREDVAVGALDGGAVAADVSDDFTEFFHEGAEVFVVEAGEDVAKGVLAGADAGHEVETVIPGSSHLS